LAAERVGLDGPAASGPGRHVRPAGRRPRRDRRRGDQVTTMANHDVIAVGPPPTFKQQVARALGRDADQVSWVPTVAAAESSLAERVGAARVVVLSPVVKETDAFGLAEFVNRTSPATAVVMVRDQALSGLLPAAMRAGIRDVVDLSVGGEELDEA